MRFALTILILATLAGCCYSQERGGYTAWKEYGLKSNVKVMTVAFLNYQQSQLYSLRKYYFSESGAIDSIVYTAASGYENADFKQLFYHTNGKTDSCLIMDAKGKPQFITQYTWTNDREYTQTEINLNDSTKTISSIMLNKQYRDWKRENKVYKKAKLIQWQQYENVLSEDNQVIATTSRDMILGTEERSCNQYFLFDEQGNFTDAIQYPNCKDSSIWIRYKKEYEYYTEAATLEDSKIFTVGTIPQHKQFEVMTAREVRIDSVLTARAKEGRQHIADGKFFVEGISKQEQQEGIEHFEASMQPYRNNRSRYFLQDYIENRLVRNEDTTSQVMTTPCECYIDNDTIKIRMGIWAFGGFSFALNLYKNQYDITYWEDTHKQFIYKQQLSDAKMMDNITVGMKEQRLVMQAKPAFTIGEKLTGYFDIKTDYYYKAEDENAELKKHNTRGEIYFKCTLRRKVMGNN